MKKFFASCALAVVAALTLCALSACAEDSPESIVGKDYLFNRVEISVQGDVSNEVKTQIEDIIDVSDGAEGVTLRFAENGVVKQIIDGVDAEEDLYYTQNGSEITLYDGEQKTEKVGVYNVVGSDLKSVEEYDKNSDELTELSASLPDDFKATVTTIFTKV